MMLRTPLAAIAFCTWISLLVFASSHAVAGPVSSRTARSGVALNENDNKLLDAAIVRALSEQRAGVTADWSDTSTGHAGRAHVLRVYSQNNAPCGEVEHIFTAGGGSRYTLPFCKQPDGAWRIQFPAQ